MPAGITTTGVLADSLDDIRSSARTIREYGPVMARLVDTTRLRDNIGLDWKEVYLNRLSATNIDELSDLEQSPQEIVDGLFSIRPTAMGMSVFVTDRTKQRIKYLPAVMAVGIGLTINNLRAVTEAVIGQQSEFKRTPKYGVKKTGDDWTEITVKHDISRYTVNSVEQDSETSSVKVNHHHHNGLEGKVSCARIRGP